MKLSRREVPIYGQAKVFALIPSVQEEEVFVVLDGSTLLHVLQTKVHNMLYFIVPGHNQPEMVRVRAYIFTDDGVMCVGVSHLTYMEDDAQELAEYLVTHSDCLSTTEHRLLIGRYGLNDNSARADMDQRVTLALANLHTPHNLLGQPSQESLLHVCVRLGFVSASEFLLCQPGALMIICSANQDGETPLQLAQQTNQHTLIKLFKQPPNPLATPLAGVSQVWAGKSHLLRFSHASGMLSLSVCVSESCPTTQTLQSSILLLQECVKDSALLNKIKGLKVDTERRAESDTLFSYSGSPYSLLHNVWFNNSIQDEDEELLSSDDSVDGLTHTDSTTSSLTDSSVTITNSINTLQAGEDQSIYPQESFDSFEFESDSTASEQDSPVQDKLPICSPQDEPFPFSDEETSTEIRCMWCNKSEEEEKEKFIPTSKSETEKYKVSRTLSFLRSRMVNTKIKNKVNAEVSSALHQLCSPQQPVEAACEVCEGADSDEPQQCTYCSMIIHKTCCDSAPLCVKNPHQALLKSTDSSILLYSSSQSSPSLFLVNDSNTMSHRKRSNSEGCGYDFTLRKSKSFIGCSSGNPTSNSTDSSAHISLDYSAESWSAVVDTEFSRTLDREVVKRQEIIYELMQTEFHHIQTLSVMADVLRRGLLEEVQLEQDVIAHIFPRLDELLALHRNFLVDMETRQRVSVHPGMHKNYIIRQIGDILCQQFAGRNASQMIELYGDFCSRHPEALKIYKQLLQSNRKLQLFLRQQSTNSVIKRREIPEFLLLVTQRITKYPVLIERLLQHTDDGSAERYDIAVALEGLRGVIEEVERCVGDYERAKKLQDIISRLDNKSCTRLKNGEIFSKQDLQKTHRTLTHSSALTCRTTSGRLKDVLALLLTDVLAFLQEKEQKFVFAALEQKSSVMPLRRLIVREIANQERGLFLISGDCSVGPEMYEIHTQTREERNMWMTLLRQAADSLPDDQTKKNEGEIKVKKIQKLQEALFSLDLQLCSVIEEKLKICRGTGRWCLATCRLLVQPHPENTPQGVTLLSDAQEEVVKLAITLLTWLFPCIWSPSNHDNFGQERAIYNEQNLPSRSRRSAVVGTGVGPLTVAPISPAYQTYLKVADGVHNLIHILYSLQAAIIIQDSCFEVQNLLLLEGEAPPQTLTSDYDVKRQSFECGVVGGTEAVKELEQREREHAELTDRLAKEKEQFEEELRLFEEKMSKLREEEKRVNEERERFKEEGKKVQKERKSLETQIRLIRHNSNHRQGILPSIISQEK
ncbi:rho guanine nucleotide exchange factor 28-like isoform X2 [Onychostoma macrolepis]|uniref:rho guanine nucleotide exchange factor 28-like isoform X2 n=1 Tax=Onychostoma macrolepis TaxID=369639 RepID=UPI00272A0AE0|nr:rho guanine nucleotide exchange factor 28-like isoform X2 [Onychostoma macrolepis]